MNKRYHFKFVVLIFFIVISFSVKTSEMFVSDNPRTKLDIAKEVEKETRKNGGKPWYRARLRVECIEYDLPYPAMRRTMWLESRELPNDMEWSKRRHRFISFGLLQMSLETAKEYRKSKGIILAGVDPKKWLLDPENNISVACWWFARNRDRFKGDWKLTIMAQNLGPDGALKMYRENGYWWPHKNQKLSPRMDAICRARVYGTKEPD
jgi:hypothetical protein